MTAASPTGSTPAAPLQRHETTAGKYFVSNYPPFAFWKPEFVPELFSALERGPTLLPHQPAIPLGLYVHIPFCRKRCHFCYFKVYTDKDSAQVKAYLDATLAELAFYAAKPFVGGRRPASAYFGGGTPSYLSESQLRHLTDAMKALLPWDAAEEVAFEGGFTDLEEDSARLRGFVAVQLGPRVLRADTAPLACLAAVALRPA